MTREQYAVSQRNLEEVQRVLRDSNLTPEARQQFQSIADALARRLASLWFPMDWGSRAIIFSIGLVGMYGVAREPHYLALAWLILPLFSPRLIDVFAHAAGRVTGFISRRSRG